MGIGDNAFEYSDITSIGIPDDVTSIGDGAFDGCESLTSINIPNSVIRIGEKAFLHCESLKFITFNGTIDQWKAI